MNDSLRRHHDAIQQVARDEWPTDETQRSHVTPVDEDEADR